MNTYKAKLIVLLLFSLPAPVFRLNTYPCGTFGSNLATWFFLPLHVIFYKCNAY